jgi:predicted Zn-ribbon and HTH transcriptional regulator
MTALLGLTCLMAITMGGWVVNDLRAQKKDFAEALAVIAKSLNSTDRKVAVMEQRCKDICRTDDLSGGE